MRATAVALAALVVLAGCVSHGGIEPVAQRIDPAALGLDEAAAAPFDWPRDDWWRGYGDARLDLLIGRALDGNPSLAVAAARLARARSFAEAAAAADQPRVNASADSTYQRYTENGLVPPPLAGSRRTSNSLLLNAGWELDFFGRYQAALDAALGQARAAQADLQAARQLLASQVARIYFQLAHALEQRSLAQATLRQREQLLELVRARVAAGLDTRVELRQAEGALPETRQRIEQLDEQIALARNALAAFTVQPAAALADLAPGLPARATVVVPTSIPADLLGRRADVAAARWRIEAALRERDAAKAEFYPNVNLAAFAGLSSLGFSRLLDSGSAVYGFGPALRLPVFDAGRLRAGLRGKTAEIDAAMESYNAAVAEAVHDVADQLASLRSVDRQAVEQRAAQQAAESAFELSVQRYRAGLGNYLSVLVAESAVIAQRRNAAELKARGIELDVALIHALGGGYVEAAAARDERAHK